MSKSVTGKDGQLQMVETPCLKHCHSMASKILTSKESAMEEPIENKRDNHPGEW
jgi:hypothetical protein